MLWFLPRWLRFWEQRPKLTQFPHQAAGGSGRRVFISYARDDDEPFVQRLHRDLTKYGFEVWWDRRSMPSRGRSYLQELRDAIRRCERLIVVIGPKAVQSQFVCVELQHAAYFGLSIVPILRLGDFSLIPSEIFSAEVQLLHDEDLSKLHAIEFTPSRSYGSALADLLRVLQVPPHPLAPLLTAVPALPKHFVPPVEAFEKLSALVLEDVQSAAVITPDRQVSALWGMAGVGKSVLAATLANSMRARRSFDHGIVWISCRGGATPLSALQQLGEALRDDVTSYVAPEEAAARLAQLLASKNLLIVLDDVWTREFVELFQNMLSEGCRLLVTTRDNGVLNAIGRRMQLKVMSKPAALDLLSRWSEIAMSNLPHEAELVAQECGYLPLALAMIGAMVRGAPADRWSDALHRLKHAQLDRLERAFPNYPHPDLLKAIEVSVEALNHAREQPRRYLDLVVFAPGTAIPEAAIATLWAPVGVSGPDARATIDLLVNRSLVLHGHDGQIVLHDLQHDYMRMRADDLPQLHSRLIDGYSGLCRDGWASGPNDGYYFSHLPYHLIEAGRVQDLFDLARDDKFQDAQLEHMPEQPDLPLQLLRAALSAAIERRDVPGIGEFLLRQGARADMAIRCESPLKLLRQGRVQRAQVVLASLEPELHWLWSLLLAWELAEVGAQDQARLFLGKLAAGAAPKISNYASDVAATILLFPVAALDGNLFRHLVTHLFDPSEVQRLPGTFSNLIVRLVNAGFDEVALELGEQFIRARVDRIREQITARKAAKGDYDGALVEVDAITAPAPYARALAVLARHLAHAGHGRKAHDLFEAAIAGVDEEGDAGEQDQMLAAIAEEEALAGWFEDAHQILLRVQGQAVRGRCLAKLAALEFRAGLAPQATLNHACEAFGEAGDPASPDLALAFAQSGDLARAEELFTQELAAPHCDDWRRLNILKMQLEAGNRDGALAASRSIKERLCQRLALQYMLVDKIRQLGSSEEIDIPPLADADERFSVLVELARNAAQEGRPRLARDLIADALLGRMRPQGSVDPVRALEVMVKILAGADQASEAADVLGLVENEETYALVLPQVVGVLVRQGKDSVVRALLRKCDVAEGDRAQVLMETAIAHEQCGNHRQACRFVEELKSTWMASAALGKMGCIAAQQGRFDDAWECWAGLEIADGRNAGGQDRITTSVAVAQTRAGITEVALETLSRLQSRAKLPACLAEMAEASCLREQLDQIHHRIQSMSDAKDRTASLPVLIRGYRRLGDDDRAAEFLAEAEGHLRNALHMRNLPWPGTGPRMRLRIRVSNSEEWHAIKAWVDLATDLSVEQRCIGVDEVFSEVALQLAHAIGIENEIKAKWCIALARRGFTLEPIHLVEQGSGITRHRFLALAHTGHAVQLRDATFSFALNLEEKEHVEALMEAMTEPNPPAFGDLLVLAAEHAPQTQRHELLPDLILALALAKDWRNYCRMLRLQHGVTSLEIAYGFCAALAAFAPERSLDLAHLILGATKFPEAHFIRD
jgi:hypothetical protein